MAFCSLPAQYEVDKPHLHLRFFIHLNQFVCMVVSKCAIACISRQWLLYATFIDSMFYCFSPYFGRFEVKDFM